jgi:hypothetical protein
MNVPTFDWAASLVGCEYATYVISSLNKHKTRVWEGFRDWRAKIVGANAYKCFLVRQYEVSRMKTFAPTLAGYYILLKLERMFITETLLSIFQSYVY